MTATTMLLPTWLERVAEGDVRWGDRTRLAAVWMAISGHPPGDSVGDAMRSLLQRWRFEPAPIDNAADVAAMTKQRVLRRWGGCLPMLGRFSPGDIGGLLREALMNAPAALATAKG
jgi:hypothetical protein